MPEFSARLSVQIELRDPYGLAEGITVEFADIFHSPTVAQAALVMAKAAPARIGAQLAAGDES